MMCRAGRTAVVFLVAGWLVGISTVMSAAGEAAPGRSRRSGGPPMPPEAISSPTLTAAQAEELAKATGLTSDVLQAGVGYIRRFQPLVARDLDNLLKVNPQQFKSQVTSAGYYARELAQLKRSDPARAARREQMLELEAQAERLSERYKEVSEAEKPKAELELITVLGKTLDLRIEEERYQLDQLKKQCDQMQAHIDDRVKNRERIVDRRLTTILGLNELLTW